MITKYFGDIPAEHLEVLNGLIELESWFSTDGEKISGSMAAKGFVSMAHDYYLMYMDEEGERLLNRANKSMPGYFKGFILEHAKDDELFETILLNLRTTPGLKVMRQFGFLE